MTDCSVDGCDQPATTWLRFTGMGDQLHAHVCPPHEALDREYCDITESGTLPCPDRLSCGQALMTATPPALR